MRNQIGLKTSQTVLIFSSISRSKNHESFVSCIKFWSYTHWRHNEPRNLDINCDKVIHKIFGSSEWGSRNRNATESFVAAEFHFCSSQTHIFFGKQIRASLLSDKFFVHTLLKTEVLELKALWNCRDAWNLENCCRWHRMSMHRMQQENF